VKVLAPSSPKIIIWIQYLENEETCRSVHRTPYLG
jgi:hypothetical protein